MKQEGRDKTFQDVAQHRESISPKAVDPSSESNHGIKMITPEQLHPMAAEWTSQPKDRGGQP